MHKQIFSLIRVIKDEEIAGLSQHFFLKIQKNEYFCIMKQAIIYIIFLCAFAASNIYAQVVYDSIWNEDIKTVSLVPLGERLGDPILQMESNDKLELRFDLLGPVPENFRYKIIHCTKEWKIDGLEEYEYINGFAEGDIENNQTSFTTLQYYTTYYQTIPSNYSTLTASGNYLLKVFLAKNPDSIVLTRRFRVCENVAKIELTAGKPTSAYGDIFKDQELSASIEISAGSLFANAEQYVTVYAQQNHRIDLYRELAYTSKNGGKIIYQWRKENVFPGGNCFRYFDISNLYTPMYNIQRVDRYGGENFAFLRPEEDLSRKSFSLTQSLNGGFKINAFDKRDPDIEADYVWVTFSLPMQYPMMDGNIYIIGDLTDWRMDEKSRMEWQPRYNAYSKRMFLKQGYYSYQLIFLPVNETEGQTSRLEGDHYQTANDYTIYVYLKNPNDRYDRLIGAKTIRANQ